MDCNLVIISSSLLFLGLSFVWGYYRWELLDLVDIFILIVSIFFGGYSLIDSLVNDLSWADPIIALWVHVLVFLLLFLVWVLSRFLPIGLQNELKLKNILFRWGKVNPIGILTLLLIIFTFTIGNYYFFGEISNIPLKDKENLKIAAPYWVTSFQPFVQPLVFCLFIGVSIKMFQGRGRARIFWGITGILLLIITGFYGRRSLFFLFFMFIILWSYIYGRNLFSFRNLKIFSFLFLILVLFSNVYISYRDKALNPEVYPLSGEKIGLLDAALNFKYSLDNLRIRIPMWQFNYLILNQQEKYPGIFNPLGEILVQGLQNSIPKVIFQEKKVKDLDEMTANLYGFLPTDYPTNNFAMFQADFGYLSLFIYPLLMFLIFKSTAIILKFTEKYFLLYLLLSGFFIYFLLNIESSYSDIILFYRNVIIIFIFYILGVFIGKPFIIGYFGIKNLSFPNSRQK